MISELLLKASASLWIQQDMQVTSLKPSLEDT